MLLTVIGTVELAGNIGRSTSYTLRRRSLRPLQAATKLSVFRFLMARAAFISNDR